MSGDPQNPPDVPMWATCRCGNYDTESVDIMCTDAKREARAEVVAKLRVKSGTLHDLSERLFCDYVANWIEAGCPS